MARTYHDSPVLRSNRYYQIQHQQHHHRQLHLQSQQQVPHSIAQTTVKVDLPETIPYHHPPPVSSSSYLIQAFANLLTYLRLYHIVSMLESHLKKLTIHEDQVDPAPIEPEVIKVENEDEGDQFVDDSINDSDLQIVKINHMITNDYHLIGTGSQSNNSFLDGIEDHDISPAPPPPKSKSSNSSVFTDLVNKRLQSYKDAGTTEDQYGTSLVASHEYLSASSRDYTPSISSTPIPEPQQPPSEAELDDDVNILDISVSNPTPVISDYKKTVLDYYIPAKPVSASTYSVLDNLIPHYYIDRVSVIYQNYHDSILSKVDKLRLDSQVVVKPLLSTQLTKVYNAWDSHVQGVFTSKFQIELYNQDLTTLRDGRWLNDNIIDYYMNLIMEGSNHKVFGWTTHFFSNLESKGYQGIVRWGKRKKLNLFEKDMVLVPINVMNTHWALAVINNVTHSIQYFDSLISSSGNMRAITLLKDYVAQEANRLNVKLTKEYELFPRMQSPQQANGYDCGVFTCTAAKYLSFNQPLRYSQNDMKAIRRRMTYEIMTNELFQIK